MWVFPDRSKSLLSGEEIINLKQNSLKDIPAGNKDYAPDNSWLEGKQIQAVLETHHTLVGAQRIEKKSSLSSAQWCPDVGKAKVTKKTGRYWEVFGHTINSEDWLLPEEVLFLLETNSLQLYVEGVPLSVEQTYGLIVGEYISLDEYRVYSHLSRKGYRVLRHDKDICVTPYEKDIHADQLSLAPKRTVPGVLVDESKASTKNVESNDDDTPQTTLESPERPGSAPVLPTSDLNSAPVLPTSDLSSAPVLPSSDLSSAPVLPTSDLSSAPVLPTSDLSSAPVLPSSDLNSAPVLATSDLNSAEAAAVPEPEAEVIDSDTNSTPANDVPQLISKSNNLISQIRNLVSQNGDKSTKPDSQFNVDDSSSNDVFPRSPPSPDLEIIDTDKNQVIEIDDDSPSDGEGEVVIMEVRKPQMDTVDLLDSDEDDDVIWINQKPSNSDPSKWRKWFASEPEFLRSKSRVTPDASVKISKVKIIDLFDLSKKSTESIWKAVPAHNGTEEFINSPDQRFIPSTVLPQFAQYRINLEQRAFTPVSGNATPAVDTTRNLNEIVSYGREPSYFSRNDGYSFHRSRNVHQNPWPPWDFNSRSQNRGFFQGHSNFRGNGNFSQSNRNFGQTDDRNNTNNQGFTQDRFGPGNYQQNRNYGNFDHQQVQRSFPPNQGGGFGPNQFGNVNMGGANDGLKMAVVQACQMQVLAMGLMQSCQSILQQVPGVNTMNTANMFPFNTLLGNMGNFNPQQNSGNFNQPQQNYRGHRPFRRPWRGGGQGRRRYYNNDRNDIARVTEIPVSPTRTNQKESQNERPSVIVIDNDDEDKKVKPALKRNMALNAIATLNQPKRARLKITTEVKSIKLDEPGPSKVEDTVQKDSLQPKALLASRVEIIASEANNSLSRSISPVDSPAKSSPVVGSPAKSPMAEEPQVASPSVLPDDGRQSALIDEQISIDSDSVEIVSEKSMDAAEPNTDRLEPVETVSEVLLSNEDSSSQLVEPMDAVDSPEGSSNDTRPEPTPENATESWKTYKECSPMKDPKDGGSLRAGNDRADIGEFMKSLQVIGPIDANESLREELKVSYDVYLPNQPFRKSIRLLPSYRVVIAKSNVFPSIFELNHLESSYVDNVPFLYAVVTSDAIRFYHLRPVSLPTLIPEV